MGRGDEPPRQLALEHRIYDAKYGYFKGVDVREWFLCLKDQKKLGAGIGAWEVTARFAYMDYRDANLPLTSTGAARQMAGPQRT
jgi:hypothetical protein